MVSQMPPPPCEATIVTRGKVLQDAAHDQPPQCQAKIERPSNTGRETIVSHSPGRRKCRCYAGKCGCRLCRVTPGVTKPANRQITISRAFQRDDFCRFAGFFRSLIAVGSPCSFEIGAVVALA